MHSRRATRRSGLIVVLAAALIITTGCVSSPAIPSPPIPSSPVPPYLSGCGELRFGAENESRCVEELQRLLILRGAQFGVTGFFGKDTRNAVQQFQRARKLPDAGLVAELTKKALYEYPQGADWDLRTECVDLAEGTEGQCATSLQRLLNQYGAGLPLPETTTYGTLTAAAVLLFQRNHQLSDSGAVRSETKEALYEHLPTGSLFDPNTEVHNCPGSECAVYLGRATTARIADFFDNYLVRVTIDVLVGRIACFALKRVSALSVICDAIISGELEILKLFRQARDDRECVKVSFEFISGSFKPIQISQADGEYCHS